MPDIRAPFEQQSSIYSAEELAVRAVERRAVEAVIWGMSAVNFDLMLQALIDGGGTPNQIAYWSRPPDAFNQTLTPNPNTIYLMPFFDTKLAGPMVLEIPAAEGGTITGSIDDAWQCALEDVGPAGADKGAGGKYLILPPNHEGEVPDGYIVLPSQTYQGYALLRSDVRSGSDADVAAAVTYGKTVRFYPLSQAANPPETGFVDFDGKPYEANIPFDRRYFRSLARMVDYEPWLERDKAMIDPLRSLGIEKGKPFAPDAATDAAFDAAASEAQAWIDAKRERMFDPPFYPGTRWAVPADHSLIEGNATFFAEPGSYPLDARAVTYSMGYFSAKHLGSGQFYLMAIRDSSGEPLDGGATYRLHVPPDPPFELYWSATAYDRETHGLVRGVSRASRGSNSPEIQANADGSVDVWFGPQTPPGKDGNWVPTDAGRGFEVLFRIYRVCDQRNRRPAQSAAPVRKIGQLQQPSSSISMSTATLRIRTHFTLASPTSRHSSNAWALSRHSIPRPPPSRSLCGNARSGSRR